MNKAYKGYLNKVSKEISSYSHEDREKILSELTTNLDQFIDTYPDSSYDDIVDNFGPPEEYIESYIAFNSPEEINKVMKHAARKKRTLVLSTVVIVLCIFIAMYVIIWIQGQFVTVIHTSDAEETHVEEGAAEEIEDIGVD